jgi:hypothetical protein
MPSRKRHRKSTVDTNTLVQDRALWRIDSPAPVGMLHEEVFSTSRLLPLIVVSSASDTGQPRLDVDELVRLAGDYANVAVVETSQAAYALSDVMPDEMRVYGGATRLFWPNASPTDPGATHPLFITPTDADGPRTLQRIADALTEAGYIQPEEGEVPDVVPPWMAPSTGSAPSGKQREADEARRLRGEVSMLRERNTELAAEVALLRKQVRGLGERNSELETLLHSRRVFEDPAEQLKHEIWLAWMHAYSEADRDRHPLAPYRFGPRFVESVETIEGVEREKVVATCVDVLTRRAWEINGRKARQMRTHDTGGSQVRVRVHDQATAWRCNIQTNSPSARRLMWWEVPDGSIELAVAALHDDTEFP